MKLAKKFQNEGRHDLFRGQARQWPVVSSLLRKEIATQTDFYKAFTANFMDFADWLGATPGGDQIVSNIDFVHATMQHYSGDHEGFRSYLIDFTSDPEVAGFFATEFARPGETDLGSIICLNSRHFRSFWDHFAETRPQWPKVEILDLDVPDLWRLQAQKGHFVQALIPFEEAYDLERIIFPVGAAKPQIDRSKIYPTRRSRLEDLVTRYILYAENVKHPGAGIDEMLEWTTPEQDREAARARYEEHAKASQSEWIHGYHPEAFRGGSLDDHPTWPPTGDDPWVRLPDERWSAFENLTIKTDRLCAAADIGDAAKVKAVLSEALQVKNWKRAHLHFVSDRIDPALSEKLNLIWDGMRPFPYTLTQVCIAIARVLELSTMDRFDAPMGAFNPFEGDQGMIVEMASTHGREKTRVYCSRKRLTDAVHRDMDQLLADACKGQRELWILMNMVFVPRKLFEFEPFVDTFVNDVIPGQLLSDRYEFVSFSPLSLYCFGNP
jgi:hypothetical protein